MEGWLKPALDELIQQHQHSLQSIEALKEEHRFWQLDGKGRDDVASLLTRLDNLGALEPKLPKLPPKPSGQPRPTKPEPADGDLCDIFLEDIDRVDTASHESRVFQEVEFNDNNAETIDGGPVPVQPEISVRKIRISTVQNFRASPGPLRKVINEVFEDAIQAAEEHAHDQEEHGSAWPCRLSEQIVANRWFEMGTGAIIFINLLTIGLEAQLSLSQDAASLIILDTMERIFLAIYSLELLVRFLAGGCAVFCNVWFLLDFFLVTVGVLAVLLKLLGPNSPLSVDGFEKILIVRGLRLLRLVRALRMFEHFKVVWHLVYALLSAGRTVMSATALISFTLYIFACVAVEIITKDENILADPETSEIVRVYFNSLPRASLTLMQFVTLDSIAAVYSPLIMKKPYLAVYFASILIFVSIGLMNLITAVIIEGAMESSAEKREEERMEVKEKIRESLPMLLDTFITLDIDRSGRITREELQNNALQLLPPSLLDKLPIDDVFDLFDILDVDENNYLTQAEFVEGLLNIALLDTPLWNIQALKLLRRIAHLTSQIHTSQIHQTQSSETSSLGVPDVFSNRPSTARL
ncbi:para [Symbiodinium pilosum]|uniref:Para protein n=1 Tax=Symbiodinium pilosum TaxID=2952 RepID=A0A812N4N7_SYMPI|nr:para [Symbiodinium pilosum]